MGVQPPGAPAPLAEWWQRLVARLIDGVLFGVVSTVLTLVLTGLLLASFDWNTGRTTGLMSPFVFGLVMAIIMTGIYVAYEFFMTKAKGQTLGKMVMGIKIAQVGGPVPLEGIPNDVALKRAGVTWGGYLLVFLPFGSLLGALAVGLNGASQLWDKPLQQTFADKVANTVVVKIK
ncbi:RDD family protein [Nonomuraea cavernae]|uniref:RDD family protein n=1 Tax=Nonomuraea cavernae TaxID=2045107 RepID=UPI0033EDC040